jgi:D-galactarolactone isomerase
MPEATAPPTPTASLARPRLQAPAGACDTHIHIYGPRDRYPLAPSCARIPPDGPLPAYRAVMQRLGLDRVVIVQPSAYGADNRATLDAMAALGDRARGVAVVEQTVDDGELARMTDAGIRGIRFFMFPGGVLSWDALEPMAARVHDFGWHVQLQLDGRGLHNREDLLRRLPGNLVIDHTGKFLEPVGVEHPGFRSLLRLLDGGRCWIKLSAPYETSRDGPPAYRDVGVLARALIEAAPERMLWASNWPHPGTEAAPPDDAVLLELLIDWAGDAATRRKILVDNPARLYGFDKG